MVTRRLILQKARHHPINEALTACRSMVSGSISLPSRGPFHLSLTVLCAIGSYLVFSLGGWAPQLPTGLLVSRRT
jgi:CHASE2 domain-containing sensor protein